MGGSMGINAAPNPGGLAGQAQVAVDPSRPGYVYELCSVVPVGAGNAMNVDIVRSTDGGQTFAAPVRVNDDPTSGAWHWFGTLAVAPDGRIDVVWNDTRASGVSNLSETYYAYSLDAGLTFSRNTPVSPQWNSTIGWPNQNKIGDYYDMRSDVAAANLAYSAPSMANRTCGSCGSATATTTACTTRPTSPMVSVSTATPTRSRRVSVPADRPRFRRRTADAGRRRRPHAAGSRATLEVEGGPAASPVFVIISGALLAVPMPLPGGALLLPIRRRVSSRWPEPRTASASSACRSTAAPTR